MLSGLNMTAGSTNDGRKIALNRYISRAVLNREEPIMGGGNEMNEWLFYHHLSFLFHSNHLFLSSLVKSAKNRLDGFDVFYLQPQNIVDDRY